jgi:hypothetical protein
MASSSLADTPTSRNLVLTPKPPGGGGGGGRSPQVVEFIIDGNPISSGGSGAMLSAASTPSNKAVKLATSPNTKGLERSASGASGSSVSPSRSPGPENPARAAGGGGAGAKAENGERESSWMSRRFEEAPLARPFSSTHKEILEHAAPGASSMKETTTTTTSAAAATSDPAKESLSTTYHTSQQGALNAELRENFETLVVGWTKDVSDLLTQLTALNGRSAAVQMSSHAAATAYEDNYQVPLPGYSDASSGFQLRRLLSPSSSNNGGGGGGSVSGDEFYLEIGGRGGEGGEAFGFGPSLLAKKIGLKLPPSTVEEISRSPVLQQQVIFTAIQELRAAEQRIATHRLLQRQRDLIVLDEVSGKPLSGSLLALHEKRFYDLYGVHRDSLSRGQSELARLRQSLQAVKDDRVKYFEGKDFVRCEEAYAAELELHRQLLISLISRLAQVDDGKQDQESYIQARDYLIELSNTAATSFQKSSRKYEADVLSDLETLTNFRKDHREGEFRATELHAQQQKERHEEARRLEASEQEAWATLTKAALALKDVISQRHRVLTEIMVAEEKECFRRSEAKEQESFMDAHAKSLLDARNVVDRLKTVSDVVAEGVKQMSSNLAARDVTTEIDALEETELSTFFQQYCDFAATAEAHVRQKRSKLDTLQRRERQLRFDIEVALETLDPASKEYMQMSEGLKQQLKEAEEKLEDVVELVNEVRGRCQPTVEQATQRYMRHVQTANRPPSVEPSSASPAAAGEVQQEKLEGSAAKPTGESSEAPAPPAVATLEGVVDPVLEKRSEEINRHQAHISKISQFYQKEIEEAERIFTDIRRQKHSAQAQIAQNHPQPHPQQQPSPVQKPPSTERTSDGS